MNAREQTRPTPVATPDGSPLITPYGSRLVQLLVDAEDAPALKEYASKLPSVQISARSLCDLELLATGAFSPLDRFMGEADYTRVVEEMRLADGTLYPMPITLPVDADEGIAVGRQIALRSPTNQLLGVMTIEELYGWDFTKEARARRRNPGHAPPARFGNDTLAQAVCLRSVEGAGAADAS